MVIIDCPQCVGSGECRQCYTPCGERCEYCGGDGGIEVQLSGLRTLAHNLAAAGGLCASWWSGWKHGSWEFGCRTSDDDDNPEPYPGHALEPTPTPSAK
jgi:hypothetical protein